MENAIKTNHAFYLTISIHAVPAQLKCLWFFTGMNTFPSSKNSRRLLRYWSKLVSHGLLVASNSSWFPLPWCPGRLYSGCKPCAVLFCPVWSTGPWPSRWWLQPSGSCRSCCSPEDPAPAACRGCWRPAESLYRWTPGQSSQRARWPAPCAHPPSRPSALMGNSVHRLSSSSPASFSCSLPHCQHWTSTKWCVSPCWANSERNKQQKKDFFRDTRSINQSINQEDCF